MTSPPTAVEHAPSSRLRLERDPSAAVERARSIIDDCPERRWTLAELATACDISPFDLCRAFSVKIGTSPYAYALHRRLQRSCALLQTDRSISAIAHDLGFADHSHFSRRFVHTFGLSPKEYRRQFRPSCDRQTSAPSTDMLIARPAITPDQHSA